MKMFCIVYHYSYELDNGQIFSETGELRTFGDQQAVVKSGAYSFVGPDGQTYWVTYTADENGFHPVIGNFFYGKLSNRRNFVYFIFNFQALVLVALELAKMLKLIQTHWNH